jgi:hypothetical protein
MQFIAQGALLGEPGVFMASRETADELNKNFTSLGFNLSDLIARNKILIDYVKIDSSKIEETGNYDLEGLFICLGIPLTLSAQNAWCWIPLRSCSPDFEMLPLYVWSYAGSSGGSRIKA